MYTSLFLTMTLATGAYPITIIHSPVTIQGAIVSTSGTIPTNTVVRYHPVGTVVNGSVVNGTVVNGTVVNGTVVGTSITSSPTITYAPMSVGQPVYSGISFRSGISYQPTVTSYAPSMSYAPAPMAMQAAPSVSFSRGGSS